MTALRRFHRWQAENPNAFAMAIIAVMFGTAAVMLAAR